MVTGRNAARIAELLADAGRFDGAARGDDETLREWLRRLARFRQTARLRRNFAKHLQIEDDAEALRAQQAAEDGPPSSTPVV